MKLIWVLALATSIAQASECPIKTKLDPTLYTLTNQVFYDLDPKWDDPAQTSGFTKTDFNPLYNFEIKKVGKHYVVSYPNVTLTHQIFIRPKVLKDKVPNPRWSSIQHFPCSKDYQKNYVTHSCTLTHEKVHVVNRDDALKEYCPQLVKELGSIKASNKKEAEDKARKALLKLVSYVGKKDTEEIAYNIEWNCLKQQALENGIVCKEQPNWESFEFLKGHKVIKQGSRIVQFHSKRGPQFEALKMGSSYKVKSLGPYEGCKEKSWYLEYGILNQVNCTYPNFSLKKVFYEFGKPQREVFIEDGKVVSKKNYYDPRQRIMKD